MSLVWRLSITSELSQDPSQTCQCPAFSSVVIAVEIDWRKLTFYQAAVTDATPDLRIRAVEAVVFQLLVQTVRHLVIMKRGPFHNGHKVIGVAMQISDPKILNDCLLLPLGKTSSSCHLPFWLKSLKKKLFFGLFGQHCDEAWPPHKFLFLAADLLPNSSARWRVCLKN